LSVNKSDDIDSVVVGGGDVFVGYTVISDDDQIIQKKKKGKSATCRLANSRRKSENDDCAIILPSSVSCNYKHYLYSVLKNKSVLIIIFYY
jgi:hypothetical protein